MVKPRRGPSPARWARSRTGSLSVGLFVWVFGTILVAFAAYAFFSIRSTSRQWEHTVGQYAQRHSELIQRSTHYGMLRNRKDDVHEIIRTIAGSEGVDGIRIYDKNGAIIFSAEPEEIGRQVDLQAEACISCHDGERPLSAVPEARRARTYTKPDGERILGLIQPIRNADECSGAACHAHPTDQTILGVLDVRMSMAGPDASLAAARRQVVLAGLAISLLIALFSAAFILRSVGRPVRQLISGVERVANGDLESVIQVESRSEIGRLAQAFNDMTRDLGRARQELTAWSDRLEVKLAERTEELSQTQKQISHMEKMASLGKLAATVAHELNNPLAGILNYAKLVERTIREEGLSEKERAELERYLHLIQEEAGRSGTIVRNLLAFARRSGARFTSHSLNDILERSVMLVRHHLEVSGIELQRKDLEGDDQLVCDPDQIQQAFVALLVNAVEAMPDGGTLRLTVERLDKTIEVHIEDSGVGIAPEDLPHVFEPFFSSKEGSKGAGLGLAVVYGIVQRHRGRIDVESEPEKGTRFRIVLPLQPPVELAAAAPASEPALSSTDRAAVREDES